MFPQKQEWRVKIGDQAASITQAVEAGRSGGLTGCGTEVPEQAVRPGATGGLTGCGMEMIEQAVRPGVTGGLTGCDVVQPGGTEEMPSDVSSAL